MTSFLKQLPPGWRADILKKRREAKQAARVFARICEKGNADQLYDAHLLLNECIDSWRPAMAMVAKLSRVSAESRHAFLPIWIESKTLPRKVGSRRVMAD